MKRFSLVVLLVLGRVCSQEVPSADIERVVAVLRAGDPVLDGTGSVELLGPDAALDEISREVPERVRALLRSRSGLGQRTLVAAQQELTAARARRAFLSRVERDPIPGRRACGAEPGIRRPRTGSFELTGPMVTARTEVRAVRLLGGEVLVAGGATEVNATDRVEVWLPGSAPGVNGTRAFPSVALAMHCTCCQTVVSCCSTVIRATAGRDGTAG